MTRSAPPRAVIDARAVLAAPDQYRPSLVALARLVTATWYGTRRRQLRPKLRVIQGGRV
ncbi:hypothetical protein ACXN5S_17795 [Pseudoroseicyclus sp. H15]